MSNRLTIDRIAEFVARARLFGPKEPEGLAREFADLMGRDPVIRLMAAKLVLMDRFSIPCDLGEGGHTPVAPVEGGHSMSAPSPSPVSDGRGQRTIARTSEATLATPRPSDPSPGTSAGGGQECNAADRGHGQLAPPADSETPDEGGQLMFVARDRDQRESVPSSGPPQDGEGQYWLAPNGGHVLDASPSRPAEIIRNGVKYVYDPDPKLGITYRRVVERPNYTYDPAQNAVRFFNGTLAQMVRFLNKRLGECTASDLYRAADDCDIRSQDLKIEAAVFRSIAAKVPHGKTVGECLTTNDTDRIIAQCQQQFRPSA